MEMRDFDDEVFSHLKSHNLSRVCRSCLVADKQTNDLFSFLKVTHDSVTTEEYISEMIYSFAQVAMSAGDGLPSTVCSGCSSRIAAAYCLRRQVQRSDRLLKSFLHHTISENNTGEDDFKGCLEPCGNEKTDVHDSTNQDDHRLLPMELEADIRSDCESVSNSVTKPVISPRKKGKPVDLAPPARHTRSMATRSKGILKAAVKETNSQNHFLLSKEKGSPSRSEFAADETKPAFQLLKSTKKGKVKCARKNKKSPAGDGKAKAVDAVLVEDECSDSNQHAACESAEAEIKVEIAEKPPKKPRGNHAPLYEFPDRPQECSVCATTCSNIRELTRHRAHDHGPKKYQCITCGNGFTTTRGLRIHLRLHTGERPEICSICGKAFSDPRTLRNHERIHSGDQPFGCPSCDKRFPARLPLAQHLLSHSGERPHRCQLCPRAYVQAGSLQVHMRSHTGVKPYACRECPKAFTNNTSLSVHMLTHNGVKNFVCPVCGKRMARSGELTVHLRTHSGERPFACQSCRKTFTSSGSLRAHMLTHTGVKNFVCTVCGWRMARAMELRVHMRTHTGERRYSCSHCPRRFITSSNMRLHERQHTGERPYACTVCSRRFADSHVLRNHERTHSGSRPFTCPLCPRAFSQQASLRAHRTTHHKGIRKENSTHGEIKDQSTLCREDQKAVEVKTKRDIVKQPLKNPREEFTPNIRILGSVPGLHHQLPVFENIGVMDPIEDGPISIINSGLLASTIPGRNLIFHRDRNQIFNDNILKRVASSLITSGIQGISGLQNMTRAQIIKEEHVVFDGSMELKRKSVDGGGGCFEETVNSNGRLNGEPCTQILDLNVAKSEEHWSASASMSNDAFKYLPE